MSCMIHLTERENINLESMDRVVDVVFPLLLFVHEDIAHLLCRFASSEGCLRLGGCTFLS